MIVVNVTNYKSNCDTMFGVEAYKTKMFGHPMRSHLYGHCGVNMYVAEYVLCGHLSQVYNTCIVLLKISISG